MGEISVTPSYLAHCSFLTAELTEFVDNHVTAHDSLPQMYSWICRAGTSAEAMRREEASPLKRKISRKLEVGS
jgi:hypothetical protein